MKVRVSLAAAAVLLLATLPAAAQTTGQPRESYSFLEAVRKQDGAGVNKVLQDKTSYLLNAKDPYTGEGALHIIAKDRNQSYLGVFLAQPGIDVNLQDKQGNTPLMAAVQSGWDDGVTALLRKKANVNLPNTAGETPLIRAVLLHNYDMARALLDAGANPDKADYSGGLTAREYAARETRYPQIAKLLADAPKNGKSAVQAAGPRL